MLAVRGHYCNLKPLFTPRMQAELLMGSFDGCCACKQLLLPLLPSAISNRWHPLAKDKVFGAGWFLTNCSTAQHGAANS